MDIETDRHKRRKAEQRIAADMSLLDIVSSFPQTEAVIKAYDEQAGECLCCAMLFASLAEIAEKYSFDQDRLLRELNAAAGT